MQVVDSFSMTIFYKKFLEWTRNDESIELTIKPKKPHWLENLNGVLEIIEDLERTTSRCHLVKNPLVKWVRHICVILIWLFHIIIYAYSSI